MQRRYLKVFFTALLLLLALFAGLMFFLDPYYHYHKPWADLPLWIHDGRYQNPGIAQNLDYDALVVGTSVSANFEAAQFDRRFDAKTRKLIVLGGFFSDFQASLDVAFDSHAFDQVFWGIDSNILGRSEEENTTALPQYLYYQNPWNDVNYLLNKEILFRDGMPLLTMAYHGEAGDEESGGFLWGQDMPWSKEQTLASYVRPELSAETLPKDALIPLAAENLEVVYHYVNTYPDVEFTLYLVPYSILYWDLIIREGKLDATLEMQRYVLEELTDRPNVKLYYFMDRYEVMANLDNYCDHIHFSPAISAQLVDYMADEAPMTREEIAPRLAALRNFVESFDYESIFEETPAAP